MKLKTTFASAAFMLLAGCGQTNSTSASARQQANYDDALDCAAYTSLALGIDARNHGVQDTPVRVILMEANRNANIDAGEKATEAGLSIADASEEIVSRALSYDGDVGNITMHAGDCTDIFASEESKRAFRATLTPTSP